MNQTVEHLRLLSIAHYILGGFSYLFSLFPVFHLFMGVVFLTMPEEEFGPSAQESDSVVEAAAAEPAGPATEAPENPGMETQNHAKSEPQNGPEPLFIMRAIGSIFTLFSGLFILAGFAVSTCMIVAGKCLAARRRYSFCFAIAVVQCAIFFPFHMALGALTIVVLVRKGTRELFEPTPGNGPEAVPET